RLSLLPLALAYAGGAPAQLPPGDGPTTVTATVLEPSPVRFDDKLLAQLRVPAGFRVSVFARDVGNVRWMVPMPNGDVYVTRRQAGDVLLLRDTNRDGVVDEKKPVVQNLKSAHGLARRGNQIYIVAEKKVL